MKKQITPMRKSILLGFIFTFFFVNKTIAQTPNSLSNITIAGISNTSAQINWQYSDPMEAPNSPFNPAAIQQFSIYYRLPNATSWTWVGNTPFRVPTSSFNINNLAPNTTYIATLTVSTSEGYEVPVIYPVNSTEFEAVTFTTGGIANQIPISNAGVDKSITLPTNSTSLSGSGTDIDGTIASYAWSVVSGPSTPTFSTTNAAATTVSNLLQGTYTLQLRVTDNLGATATDLMVLTVNPAVIVACTNDNFEPNNTSASASALSVGTNLSAKICPLNDVDFFRFNNTNATKNIRVTLSNLPTNYIVELYAPNGSLASSNSTAGTANKVIVFNTSTVGTYRVRVLAGSGAVANNSNYTLRAETSKNAFPTALRLANPSSIKEVEVVFSNNDITLYPNPTENFLNFESSENKIIKCIIYNQQGIQVGEKSSKDGLTNYDMSALDKGIYTIQLENSNGEIVTKKVIKK